MPRRVAPRLNRLASNVFSMRRRAGFLIQLVTPLLVTALTVAGCTSSSATKRTVTVVNTVSAGAASPSTARSVIVAGPSTSRPPTTKVSTPKPTPTRPSVAPIVKVNPMNADCAVVLDAADIKKAIGATVGTTHNRIRLGPAAHGVVGAIRCLFGSKDNGRSAPVRIRLTQYNSAAAAKAQVEVDVRAAQDGNAVVTQTTVNGYPASLQLQAGGVVEMTYDTWSLSLAVSDKLASNATLTTGLPKLAGQALTRIIKNN